MTLSEVREAFKNYNQCKAVVTNIRTEIDNLERIKAELENEAYGGVLSRGGEGSSGKDFGVSDPTPAQAERFAEGVDRTAVAEIAQEIIVLRNRMAMSLRTIRMVDEWVAQFSAETATLLRSRLIERKSMDETLGDLYEHHKVELDELTAIKRIARALDKIVEMTKEEGK